MYTPCECYLIVEGNTNQIEKFKQMVKGDDTVLSLASLCPMPEELEYKSDKKSSNWCEMNWGTVIDVEDAKLTEASEDYLEYFFISAWSPPIAWLKKAAKEFPTLNFKLKYIEVELGFMGIARAKQGRVKDRCLDTS